MWGVTFGGYLAKILSFKSGNLLYKSNFYLLSEATVLRLLIIITKILPQFHEKTLIAYAISAKSCKNSDWIPGCTGHIYNLQLPRSSLPLTEFRPVWPGYKHCIFTSRDGQVLLRLLLLLQVTFTNLSQWSNFSQWSLTFLELFLNLLNFLNFIELL